MSNYKIVSDEKELKRFINWLPDLNKNEKFYFSLFARKKYCQDLIKSNDKTQLYRSVSNKEDLFKKFKQLERPLGNYTLKNTEVLQESLVLYMIPNPRDTRKASYMLSKKLLDLVYNNDSNYNPITEAKSCYQKSKSYNYVVDFDIDSKDIDLQLIKDYFRNLLKGSAKYFPNINEVIKVVETRGGYHILIKPNLMSKLSKTWYQDIINMYPCDQAGDQLLPVPGCIQGNFVPKIIEL